MTPLPYRNAALPIAERVADLLSRMTLEEKVAQMSVLGWPQPFGPDNLPHVLGQHGAGEVAGLGLHRSPRETAELYNAIQRHLLEQTRLGIPALSLNEALHGAMAKGNTSFPQAIALASTWDVELVREVFAVAAREMRAHGGNHALSPVLDLARDPRWGRTEETYGEDPYLVSRIGVAAIRGLQGDELPIGRAHVAATTKHFAVHGQPEAGTNGAPGNYSEREIREAFLAPFHAAVVEARAQCVMASYNEINGLPAHINRWLLQSVLREEWGFEGFVTSDGFALTQLHVLHGVAADAADAARQALATGVDFELDRCFFTLVAQVRSGHVPEALIDQAVSRILRAKFLLGLFEHPYVDADEAERVVNNAEHRALALKAAHRAITLLKNQDELLPLDVNRIRTLAVIGPNAADAHFGGYTSEPAYGVSVLEGVRAKVGGRAEVVYAEGCRITEGVQGWRAWWEDAITPPDPAEDEARLAEAVRVAARADVVLLVLGENESTCREGWAENHLGDRDTLDLPGRQDELTRAVLATGKPVVVLLLNGRPLSINAIAQHAPAIVEGWYLGQEGGPAVANVLFGDVNPGGKLPITFPRSVGQIPAYYYHKPSARRGYVFADKTPLFPFGHGLSYTTFAFRNLRVTPERIARDGTATVSVEVTNTGTRAGDEVAQVYLHDRLSSVTRPVKQLRGFQRLALQPGETRPVAFTLTAEDLQLLDKDLRPVVEPGQFEVMVGPSSAEVQTVILEVEA